MTNTEIEYEYACRSYDSYPGAGGEVIIKPTLAMAQDRVDYLHRINATRNTYGIRAEVVIRPEGTDEWAVLTAEEVKAIQDEAWKNLDEAFTPIIAAALTQAKGDYR